MHSMETIQDKWPIHSGRIRVRVIGEARELPADLRAIVEATDPDDCIEGNVLVDLCRQRSSQRGSGCDAPIASIETPHAHGIFSYTSYTASCTGETIFLASLCYERRI